MPGSTKAVVWRERLRRYGRAELTVAEFCRREGVSTPSFYQWRRRLGQTEAQLGSRPSTSARPQSQGVQRSTDVGRPARAAAFQQVLLSGGGLVVLEWPSGVRLELPAHQVQLVRSVVADVLQTEAGRSPGNA